ncbi:MAG: hypothetical protein IPJ04_05075 [Candidatus Eisenbacteria bacterium]|nr:hypothetical protein [Candidatus Eisenbacteria bacterium]
MLHEALGRAERERMRGLRRAEREVLRARVDPVTVTLEQPRALEVRGRAERAGIHPAAEHVVVGGDRGVGLAEPLPRLRRRQERVPDHAAAGSDLRRPARVHDRRVGRAGIERALRHDEHARRALALRRVRERRPSTASAPAASPSAIVQQGERVAQRERIAAASARGRLHVACRGRVVERFGAIELAATLVLVRRQQRRLDHFGCRAAMVVVRHRVERGDRDALGERFVEPPEPLQRRRAREARGDRDRRQRGVVRAHVREPRGRHGVVSGRRRRPAQQQRRAARASATWRAGTRRNRRPPRATRELATTPFGQARDRFDARGLGLRGGQLRGLGAHVPEPTLDLPALPQQAIATAAHAEREHAKQRRPAEGPKPEALDHSKPSFQSSSSPGTSALK